MGGSARLGLIVAIFLLSCGPESGVDQLAGDTESRLNAETAAACARLLRAGLRPVAKSREQRFLGKVEEDTARCRGGPKAVEFRATPWVDWANYWATGDGASRSRESTILDHLDRNGRGIDGALMDLEYQRIELIKFNLFDNYTYADYLHGRDGVEGQALATWDALRLPPTHVHYAPVGGAGKQVCSKELIRFRNLAGHCNDIRNPLMGSTNTLFARNVEFESTFPRLGRDELARNRHGDRLGLLKPDPQLISRVLFTRPQSAPDACRSGMGLPDDARDAHCDYTSAPFFNVLAAFWIQFMTHDWFSHLVEGHNAPDTMALGCKARIVDGVATPLTAKEIAQLGCRPDDRMDMAYVADSDEPPTTSVSGRRYLSRAPRTFTNTVTAWWDASQIYGYDELSRQRVKRDPRDRARLLLVDADGQPADDGYLPLLTTCQDAAPNSGCTPDPMNPAWAGQEATAFPDNFTIGMSFYHNVFAREHNMFVDTFRKHAEDAPDADSGLRNPAAQDSVIRHRDVTDEELFEVARLVVAMQIAKIHTIEWTTQLLYNEPLFRGMNGNWGGLFEDHALLEKALGKVVSTLGESTDAKKSNQWYSVLAAGPGIVGLGSRRYAGRSVFGKFLHDADIWDMRNPDHVNGGVNHFGSPFNFPEEFVSVYRLHPLVPDLIEFRDLSNVNAVRNKVPVAATFRGRATDAMRKRGLANWGLSMGRQRLGALTLNNHPQFLQNLAMPRLTDSPTGKIDVAALDIIRDRERGVPRFNEFRRQYGLRQLTRFDDFVDRRLSEHAPQRREQMRLVERLREVYGQHRCDVSKVITRAQVNEDGSAINDCLGHPDGSLVDNVEDIDTVVGWLAESTRPHGFAISETQFVVFILNASRRLFSDRFFTSSFRPEFYTTLGYAWVIDNGPDGKVVEKGRPNGHEMVVAPLKRVLLRTVPELAQELAPVVNTFDPWARDRGEYYSLAWQPRAGAEADKSFPQADH